MLGIPGVCNGFLLQFLGARAPPRTNLNRFRTKNNNLKPKNQSETKPGPKHTPRKAKPMPYQIGPCKEYRFLFFDPGPGGPGGPHEVPYGPPWAFPGPPGGLFFCLPRQSARDAAPGHATRNETEPTQPPPPTTTTTTTATTTRRSHAHKPLDLPPTKAKT